MTTPDSPDCEILPDEAGDTCAGIYALAHAFFATHGIDIQTVMTDNAFAYTKAVTCRQTLTELGVKHVRIRPRRPQTNGKVEQFNRTLLEEWAYVRTYRSNRAPTRALDRSLHTYNHHRTPHVTRRPTTHDPRQQRSEALHLEGFTMVTICVAGQSSVSIGVLIDALSVQGDVRVVGLPNPSDVPGSRTRWQPSLREKLKEYSIPEVSLKWCENNPDIILVSCEYERLLNVDRFSTARLYNVHFSLLPAHKGAYPTTFAVLRGDSQVGPTLHWIDAGIDTGPIVAQSPTSIGPDMTALDVYMVCQINGRKLVRRNWEGLLSGRACSRPQPSEGSTFESRAGLDFAALSQVNAKASAEQVKRQIAAANFRPYQLPTFNGFTISGAQILETESRQRYGTVLHQEKSLIRVATIDFDIELMIDQYPRFWDACRQGHFQDARSMLPSLHRIDEYDEFGRRALYYAIKSESIRTVRVLLESGATASDLDGFGTSAYSLATAMSSTETRNSMLKLIEELTNVLPNRRPDSDSPSSHQASE